MLLRKDFRRINFSTSSYASSSHSHESYIIIESRCLRFFENNLYRTLRQIWWRFTEKTDFLICCVTTHTTWKLWLLSATFENAKRFDKYLCARAENSFTSQSRKSLELLSLKFRSKSISWIYRCLWLLSWIRIKNDCSVVFEHSWRFSWCFNHYDMSEQWFYFSLRCLIFLWDWSFSIFNHIW